MRIVRLMVFAVAVGSAETVVRASDRIVPPAVPLDIEVEAGFEPFFLAHAIGTQNYICAPSAAGPKWLFI